MGDIVGVAPDGTIYTVGNVSSMDYHAVVRAFGADGTPVPDWPADGVPLAGLFRDAVLDGAGGVYVSMTAAPTSANAPRATAITALDAHGQVRTGWPVVRPKTTFEHYVPDQIPRLHRLVARPSGGVCFAEEIGTSATTAPKSALNCLGEDGRDVVGWPYAAQVLGTPVFGPDGTLYVNVYGLAVGGALQSQIVAMDPNGQPRSTWRPVDVPATTDPQILIGSSGTIWVLAKPHAKPPVLIALDANGTPDEAFDTHAAAILGSLEAQSDITDLSLGADQTLYLTVFRVSASPSKPAEVIALGADGAMRPGWPFSPGSIFLTVYPAPDGTIWVRMGSGGADETRFAMLGHDGAILQGWPVLGPPNPFVVAFDGTGTPFFVARPYGLDYLETIDQR
jgi:hypothetical protein